MNHPHGNKPKLFEVTTLDEQVTLGRATVVVIHESELRYFPSTLRAFYEEPIMPLALWENIVAPQQYASASVYMAELNDCFVTPSGVIVTQDGRLVEESMHPFSQHTADRSFFKELVRDELGLVDLSQPIFRAAEPIEEAVFAREFGESGFFHLMSSVVPRVLMAKQRWNSGDLKSTLGAPDELPPILYEPWTDIGEQAMRVFDFVRAVRRANGRVLRIKRLYFPSPSQRGDSHFTRSVHLLKGYETARQSLERVELPSTLASYNGRLFLSRRDAASRRLENEDEVVSSLKGMAFHSVESSGLSLQEQIAMFKKTYVVVAAHGAGLVNALFMKPGSVVVEILSPSRLWPSFRVIAALMGHEYIAIVGSGETANGDFSVNPELVRRIVASAVGDYSHGAGRRSPSS